LRSKLNLAAELRSMLRTQIKFFKRLGTQWARFRFAIKFGGAANKAGASAVGESGL
jgi:hypothetical protein